MTSAYNELYLDDAMENLDEMVDYAAGMSGWILAYYQWITGKRFEDIFENGLPLSQIMSMYILHEADVIKFVDVADGVIERNKAEKTAPLQRIRKARGFTQQELSDASGVSFRMIQLYEQRQNDIR